MIDISKVADGADFIVNGYSYTKTGNVVRVLNLNKTTKAAVIDSQDEIIETSMDDIELDIIMNYYNRNKKYMEE